MRDTRGTRIKTWADIFSRLVRGSRVQEAPTPCLASGSLVLLPDGTDDARRIVNGRTVQNPRGARDGGGPTPVSAIVVIGPRPACSPFFSPFSWDPTPVGCSTHPAKYRALTELARGRDGAGGLPAAQAGAGRLSLVSRFDQGKLCAMGNGSRRHGTSFRRGTRLSDAARLYIYSHIPKEGTEFLPWIFPLYLFAGLTRTAHFRLTRRRNELTYSIRFFSSFLPRPVFRSE